MHGKRYFWMAALLATGLAYGQETTLPEPEEVFQMAVPVETSSVIEDEERGEGPTITEEVVIIVNQERWTNGQLPPLKHNDLLDTSSLVHSTNMGQRNFFAHCDLDTGKSPWDRMVDAGYNWNAAAENIAAGQNSAASVMNAWMNSTGHRNNILSTNTRELGVGYYVDNGDTGNVRMDNDSNCIAEIFNQGPFARYWTQNFGRRSNVYPVVINREAWETEVAGVDLYLYGSDFADEMRIRNSDGDWTEWQPFATNVPWTLVGSEGFKEVQVEIRSGSTVREASDTIYFAPICVSQAELAEAINQWAGRSLSILELVAMVNLLCL